jgi:hypothetical protein
MYFKDFPRFLYDFNYGTDNNKTSTINQVGNNMIITNKVNNGSLQFNAFNSSGSSVKVVDITSSGTSLIGDCNIVSSDGSKLSTINQNTNNLVISNKNNGSLAFNTLNSSGSNVKVLDMNSSGCNVPINLNIVSSADSSKVSTINQNTNDLVISNKNNSGYIQVNLLNSVGTNYKVLDINSNGCYVNENLYLNRPLFINTYVAPSDSSQIGYTFTGSYSQMVDSTMASNYTLLSANPISFSAGTWIVNSRFEISTGGTSTTFKFGWTYSNSIGTVSKLNVMSASTNGGLSVNKSIDSSYTYSENASFTHSFSNPTFVYLWYYLKWNTSGTLVVYYQFTRIA